MIQSLVYNEKAEMSSIRQIKIGLCDREEKGRDQIRTGDGTFPGCCLTRLGYPPMPTRITKIKVEMVGLEPTVPGSKVQEPRTCHPRKKARGVLPTPLASLKSVFTSLS